MEIIRNNPALLLLGILSVLNVVLLAVLFWRFQAYQKKQKELLSGGEVASLDELVLKHKKTLVTHERNMRELGKILEELVDSNKHNVQKIGVVRFNPFADAGGNMSFSLALLDGFDDGIVISSLHSREGTRIYGKPIEGGKSKYPLTDEEKEAILKANERAKI